MGLLADLVGARYLGGVGPGVYDVHSPAVPEVDQIRALLDRAVEAVGPDRLWVNPDCGLKTRRYDEALPALRHMVAAAHQVRSALGVEA
jgi:5-methyltetrahydropteroyltriglutamate--homocysteine methyltransferase